MASGYGFSLDSVLQMLTSTLVPEGEEAPRQVVFLLGAGCSRQYGLPNFKELLAYIWDDCFEVASESLGGFQTLRDELDRYWQAQGPEARKKILRRHLSQNHSLCPGYHRLAMLARDGYVKAIVNMNFDDLLERELERVLLGSNLKLKISTSFRVGTEPGDSHLMVYKPHGTIGNFDVLDRLDHLLYIANTAFRIVSSYRRIDRSMLFDLETRVRTLNQDNWWIPKEILESTKDLVRTVRDLIKELEKTNPDLQLLADEMAQAIRRISQARRSPLWAANDLILDIANSDLFADPGEQIAAQDLLTSHDVVSIGYSGVDAKIAAALRTFKAGTNPRDRKLYFVNLDPPDPRILLVLAERASQNLCISAEDAAFENFMEQLQIRLQKRLLRQQILREDEDQARPGYQAPNFLHLMTRDESLALEECLRLALSVRAAINVGDRSSVSIEEHGNDVYRHCSRLADISGICLTSPEKFLLHATAFLHDLGYFSAYSGGHVVTGLELLRTHGRITADLLRQRIRDDSGLTKRIVPASYKLPENISFVDILLALCQYHPSYDLPEDLARFADVKVEVLGVTVPVRFPLLHTVFSVAEHLVREHPFRPSSDPVIDQEESAPPIDDPILDLYLRRRESEVTFLLKRKRVEGRLATRHKGKAGNKQALWLLSMANAFVERLTSKKLASWPVKFHCEEKLPESEDKGKDWHIFKPLLKEALEEELERSLNHVNRWGRTDVARLLDQAEEILNQILPSDSHPDLLGDVPAEVAQDLNMILSRVRVWVIAVRTELRENWIADMGENLRLAELLLKGVPKGKGHGISEPLTVAGEAVRKAAQYFENNSQRAAIHAAPSTLEAARKVVEWLEDRVGPTGNLKELLDDLILLLTQFGSRVKECAVGELVSILDLLSIYTLPVVELGADVPEEPRVSLDREPVRMGLARVQQASRIPPQGLLHLYLPLKQRWPGPKDGDAPPMEGAFLDCYEAIIHPAWRFFARNWHDRSEPLLMARACLDLGSSAFRPEVAGGIKYLLGEKVEWDNADQMACGHDGCTICTSRLLYVLSSARRLFVGDDLERLSHNAQQKGLNQTVAGLLRYFRSRGAKDQSWWGLGSEEDATRGVYSADYLAWAARAVTYCRSVDEEIQARTGRSWLEEIGGATSEEMDLLVRQRWEQFFSVRKKGLLSERTEEPATFTLGRVALAALDIQRMDPAARALMLVRQGKPGRSFIEDLEEAKKEVWKDSLAQMSRLYMLPVFLVLDSALESPEAKEKSALEIVELCRKGIQSRIWIRKGADRGSWGFNVKNSQAIVTALMAFWRYAFEPENYERFEKAFREASTDPAVAPKSAAPPAPEPPRGRRSPRRRSRPAAGGPG